jgi:hypothetical protein
VDCCHLNSHSDKDNKMHQVWLGQDTGLRFEWLWQRYCHYLSEGGLYAYPLIIWEVSSNVVELAIGGE